MLTLPKFRKIVSKFSQTFEVFLLEAVWLIYLEKYDLFLRHDSKGWTSDWTWKSRISSSRNWFCFSSVGLVLLFTLLKSLFFLTMNKARPTDTIVFACKFLSADVTKSAKLEQRAPYFTIPFPVPVCDCELLYFHPMFKRIWEVESRSECPDMYIRYISYYSWKSCRNCFFNLLTVLF